MFQVFVLPIWIIFEEERRATCTQLQHLLLLGGVWGAGGAHEYWWTCDGTMAACEPTYMTYFPLLWNIDRFHFRTKTWEPATLWDRQSIQIQSSYQAPLLISRFLFFQHVSETLISVMSFMPLIQYLMQIRKYQFEVVFQDGEKKIMKWLFFNKYKEKNTGKIKN